MSARNLFAAAGLALVFALAPSLARAVDPTWPTGGTVTTYRFQEGVDGYTGCADVTIHYGGWRPLVNFGQEDTLALSSIVADSSESIILVRFDNVVSAVPSNGIVLRARQGIYKFNKNPESVAFVADEQLVRVYRIMDAWDEGTGNGFYVGALSTTGGAGAMSTYAKSGITWAGVSVDGQGVWNPFIRTGADESTRDTSSVGASGYWGTDILATSTTFSIPSDPEAEFYLRTRKTPPGGSDPDQLGSHIVDLTHYWQLVFQGVADNNGVEYTNSTSLLAKRAFFASSEHPNKPWRPWLELIVWVPDAASSSSTATKVGGNGRSGAR